MLYTGTLAERNLRYAETLVTHLIYSKIAPKKKCDNRVLCSILNRLMSLFPKYATKSE